MRSSSPIWMRENTAFACAARFSLTPGLTDGGGAAGRGGAGGGLGAADRCGAGGAGGAGRIGEVVVSSW
jgi:hypothetical protein